MDNRNYKYLYEKYKKKYLILKNNNGGSTSQDLSSQEINSQPFDSNIFTKQNTENPYDFFNKKTKDLDKINKQLGDAIYIVYKQFNPAVKQESFKIGEKIENINEFIIYFKNEYNNTEDKDKNLLKIFMNNTIKHFVETLQGQFVDNKISDHKIITHIVDNTKVLSLSILDDTFERLYKIYENVEELKKFNNAKLLYTLALTISLDILREQRISKIIELISGANVLCFQELNFKTYSLLKEKLFSLGYDRNVTNQEKNRAIFYKKSEINQDENIINLNLFKESGINLGSNFNKEITGEIKLRNESQPILILNNLVFISVDSSNNNTKDELKNLIKNLGKAKDSKSLSMNKVILIGNYRDNNISGKKELSSQIVVHQSNTETSFKQLNNSDRIDNVIEISLV